MVVTNDHILPTEEELTVTEVELSTPALRAGAFHLGKSCENENNVSSKREKQVIPLIVGEENYFLII